MSDEIKSGDDMPTIVIKLQNRIEKLESIQKAWYERFEELEKEVLMGSGICLKDQLGNLYAQIAELKERLIRVIPDLQDRVRELEDSLQRSGVQWDFRLDEQGGVIDELKEELRMFASSHKTYTELQENRFHNIEAVLQELFISLEANSGDLTKIPHGYFLDWIKKLAGTKEEEMGRKCKYLDEKNQCSHEDIRKMFFTEYRAWKKFSTGDHLISLFFHHYNLHRKFYPFNIRMKELEVLLRSCDVCNTELKYYPGRRSFGDTGSFYCPKCREKKDSEDTNISRKDDVIISQELYLQIKEFLYLHANVLYNKTAHELYFKLKKEVEDT